MHNMSSVPSRAKVVLVLVAGACVFAVLKMLEGLLFGGQPGGRPFTWSGLAASAAGLMMLFWYGIFVLWGHDKGWLGPFRRPVNAAMLATACGALKWADVPVFDGVLWGFVTVGFVVGWFAEKWVGGM